MYWQHTCFTACEGEAILDFGHFVLDSMNSDGRAHDRLGKGGGEQAGWGLCAGSQRQRHSSMQTGCPPHAATLYPHRACSFSSERDERMRRAPLAAQ